MEKIIKYLKDVYNQELYFSEYGCKLIHSVQEMITRERIVIRNEKKISIPGCLLFLTNQNSIDAFSTKIDEKYCVFIYKGVIEDQKLYLEQYNWSFVGQQKDNYINDIIKYGFYFLAFHEYAHIYCGYTDGGLTDANDKTSQECEADMFSMDYLMKYILVNNDANDYVCELEKLYFAIYFLLEKMQKQHYEEFYNGRLIQNYYDLERIKQRSHPLDFQRMLYLYKMLNVIIGTDKLQILPVKDSIIEKLISIKGYENRELPNRDGDYIIAEESVQNLIKSLEDIRKKIPRISIES